MQENNIHKETHILYVDSNEQYLDDFKSFFGKYFHVHTVMTVDQAKEILKQYVVEVVLSEQQMSEMTGTEFFEEIDETYPRSLKVIITTLDDMDAVIESINNKNVFQFVKKPWDVHQLLAVINNAIATLRLDEKNKETTEALLESEERFRGLINYAPDGILLINRKGDICLANDRISKMFGYEIEEVQNQPIERLIPPRFSNHTEMLEKYFENPRSFLLGEKRQIFGLCKDGTELPVEINIGTVQTENGIQAVAIVRDVSDKIEAKNQLEESEQRFRDIAESMADWFWEIDKQGNYTFCAGNMKQTIGYEAHELIGKSAFDVIAKDEMEQAKLSYRRMAENLEPIVDFENWNYTKDGKRICFLTNGKPIFNNEGNYIGYRGVNKNITERKNIEQKLLGLNEELEHRVIERTYQLENEKKFNEHIINSIPGIFFILDKDFEPIKWNKTFEQFYTEPHKNKRLDFFAPIEKNQHQITRQILEQVLQTGDTAIEIMFKRDDGRTIPFQITMHKIIQQNQVFIIGNGFDLTERKKIEQGLLTLSQAIEQSPVSVLITNHQGSIEYVNPIFEKITGYSAAEVLGNNPRLFKSGKHAGAFYTDLWTTITGGNIWHGELCNKHKDGHLFWESVSISPIRNELHEITHYVAVKEDITKRKTIENELIVAYQMADEANKARGQFLANMSHEIRTPLNAIIGMSYLLNQTSLNDKQMQYVDRIHYASNNLLGLLNNVLDFSKIEAGKLALENISFKVDELVKELIAVTSLAAQKKGLEYNVFVNPKLPNVLKGDPLRLGQVLLNLVNNAIKFTAQGKVEVLVEPTKHDENATSIQFTIRDTGIGLNEDQMKNLFKAFTQADGSTTRKYGGTGLGLSICKSLIEQMGGKIWVESTPSIGSSFIIEVSFNHSTNDVKGAYIEKGVNSGAAVLLVDDNKELVEANARLLQRAGYKTAIANNGAIALEVIEKSYNDTPFDIIILDWNMPVINGSEFLDKLCEMDIPIPKIIVLTAENSEEIKASHEHYPISQYMEKPFLSKALVQQIKEVLNESNDQQDAILVPHETTLDNSQLEQTSILLVEDNEINQLVATEILEGKGIKITVASDGKQALDILDTTNGINSFDLILMDLRMPIMNGYQAVKEIRKLPDFKDLPIIAMSADSYNNVQKSVFDVGFNDFISKPILPNQLFSVLQKWTSHNALVLDGYATYRSGDFNKLELQHIETLPGIAIKNGLYRLQGNEQVYVQICTKFRDKFKDSVSIINSLVAEGNREEVKRYLHTIKGVAGNLGANLLSNKAHELEEHFDSADKMENQQLLQEYQELLDVVLESLETIISMYSASADAEEEQILSQKDFMSAAEEFRTLLVSWNMSALDYYPKIKNNLPINSEYVIHLEDDLNHYEFEEALKNFNIIMKHINNKNSQQ